MKIKTKSGFTCNISDHLMNDYRFLKAHRALSSTDAKKSVQAVVDLVSIVFNDETEEERFLQHLADEEGRVPTEKVYQELGEILVAAGEKNKSVKNS